ncbi:MAG: BON domain-containing protein [Fimbriiglobus sp.]
MNLRNLALSAVALGMMGGISLAKDTKSSPAMSALPKPSNLAKPVTKAVEKTVEKTEIKQTSATTPVAESSIQMNQKLAESIATRLTSSNVAEGADISIVTEAGTVTVTGPCKSAAQKNAILQEVRVVVGVKMVRDGLTVGSNLMQAQAVAPGMPPMGMPPMGGMPMGMGGPLVEPAPLGAPGQAMGDGFAPPMPPHSWPTYAPYNNVSRVGYPTAYPHNAFPFIGPFYPFPKVPLGWRSVNLTWEDGHWWYGRTSTPQDYWRVRFW